MAGSPILEAYLSVVGKIMKASRAALAFCCIKFTKKTKAFVILMLSYFLLIVYHDELFISILSCSSGHL